MSVLDDAEDRVERRLGVLIGRPMRSEDIAPLSCSGTDVPGTELAAAIDRATQEAMQNAWQIPLPMEIAGMLLRTFWLGWEARDVAGKP